MEDSDNIILRSGTVLSSTPGNNVDRLGLEGMTPDQIFELRKLQIEAQAQIRAEEAQARAEEARAQMRAEEARAQAQASETQRNFELEMRRMDLESERIRSATNNDPGNRRDSDKWIQMVKNSLPKLEVNKESITHVFATLEAAFDFYEVPEEVKPLVLIALIGYQIPNLYTICDKERLKNYWEIKRVILREYRMSPLEYLKRFQTAKKSDQMNFSQYANQLLGVFNLYIECRNVTTMEELRDLVVCDQFKSGLNPGTLRQVLLHEMEGHKTLEELSAICQNYEDSLQVSSANRNRNSHSNEDGRRANNNPSRTERMTESNRPYQWRDTTYFNRPEIIKENCTFPNPDRRDRRVTEKRKCFICGAETHLKSQCPKAKETQSDVVPKTRQAYHVRQENEGGVLNTNSLTSNAGPKAMEIVTDYRNELTFETIYCNGRPLKALVDSGSEMTIIREGLVTVPETQNMGITSLKGAFGSSVPAQLVQVAISLEANDEYPKLLLAAIAKDLLPEAIIPPNIYQSLKRDERLETLVAGVGSDFQLVERTDPDSESEEEDTPVETTGDHGEKEEENHESGDEEFRRTDSKAFAREQKECETLIEAWEKAKTGKENYYISDGILMHRDVMCGERISQMVTPLCRRELIMAKGHSETSSAHLGEVRSNEKIRKSFFWPTLKRDVRLYCQSCPECQSRRVVTCKDRVPIQALTRPENAFEVWVIDITGPLDPPSSKGHKYLLTAVDLCTRWPEAIPLRSIHAKQTCEALIQIFSRTGLPRMICSDGGTNFTSKLTAEFTKLLGISPRFAPPAHPNSPGTVERFHRTRKAGLHHVMIEHGRKWHEYLPLLLFAYREATNRTVGASPFQLVYGFLPLNPLSLLKDMWLGTKLSPTGGERSTLDYIENLKAKIQTAMDSAKITASMTQERHVEEVSRRMKELPMLRFVEKSPSAWAAPIVCVATRESSDLRIGIDSRHLKKFTKRDAHPMVSATDMRYAIGKANFISTLGITREYWPD